MLKDVDEVSVKLDEKDREILKAMENLDLVQRERHDTEKKVVDLTEIIRQGKYNLARLKVEREVLEREKWTIIRQSKVSV